MAYEHNDDGLDKTRSFSVLAQGTVISHYRIIKKNGEGSMSFIYKAEDTKLNHRVHQSFYLYSMLQMRISRPVLNVKRRRLRF